MKTNKPLKRRREASPSILTGAIQISTASGLLHQFEKILDLELVRIRREMVTLYRMQCSNHPMYSGIRKPRARCEQCWNLYNELN